jgi:hypothetical protein
MNNTKDRQKLSWEGMFYSIQRIDLLIVLLSGAGIYVCLETIKYLTEKELNVHLSVKISGVFFLVSIMINFLSQIFGYKANEQDFLMCQTKIEAGEKTSKKEEKEIKEFDKKSDKFSNLTNKFNYLSIAFMFLGLITIMFYFLFTF